MSDTLALIEHVKQIGVQIDTPEQIADLLIAIRYAEDKIGSNLSDARIASNLGISAGTIKRITNAMIQTPKGMMSYMQIATQILLVDFFTEERKTDRRSRIYGSFDTLLPEVVENQLRLAAGRPGIDSSKPPSYRDQIDAAKGIWNNPITMSYMQLVLTGKDTGEWQIEVPKTMDVALTLD